MRFSFVTAVLGMATAAAAKDISVKVGENGKFAFDPENILAAPGDTVTFFYFGLNHSVTQGDLNNACHPPADGSGFNSGFNPPASGQTTADKVFRITINTTDAMAVYCAQPVFVHCMNGMVAMINPNNSFTIDDYKAAAAKVDQPTMGDTVQGGIFIAASDAGSSSSGSGSSSSSNTSSAGGSSSSSGSGSSSSDSSGSSSGSSSAAPCGIYGCPSSSASSLGSVVALALGMAVLLL